MENKERDLRVERKKESIKNVNFKYFIYSNLFTGFQ